jgi:hypothetical protein
MLLSDLGLKTMNIFELLIFSIVCVGLGVLGHLVSPRYGWLLGAVPAVAVFVMMLIASFRRTGAGLNRCTV